MNQQHFRDLIVELISKELKVAPESLPTDAQFTQFGMDSIAALTVSGELEDAINQKLPTTLLWDYSTIDALASHLAQRMQSVCHDTIEA